MDLRDGNENAWPPDGQKTGPTSPAKVALFVLAHLLASYDFLPRASGIFSLKIRESVLNAVRSPNLLTKPIVEINGKIPKLNVGEGMKRLATVFCFQVR